MKQKYNNLIRLLRDEKGFITAQNLSHKMGISVRSVKSYIAEINKIQPNSILSGREGYRLQDETFSLPETKAEAQIPQTPEERATYIIHRLLSAGKAYSVTINLFDLAEELCVSYETVRKDLQKVRGQLLNYDLSIQISNHEMVLEGRETDIRKMMGTLLYYDFNDNVITMEIIQNNFPQYDGEFLKTLIEEKCRYYHYYINGYSLQNLLLDVLIGMDRIQQKYIAAADEVMNSGPRLMGVREMELTREIASVIEDKYGIVYPEVEIDTLGIMLISYLMHIDYEKMELGHLDTVIDQECMHVVEELLKEMESYVFCDVSNQEFIIRFALHIKNLMTRLEYGYSTQNALTEHIKNTCPLVFDCAVVLSNRIKELTGHDVDEDEKAYIALHIGATLDTQKSMRQIAACVIVFPQYYNMANTLNEKIMEKFQQSLMIQEIVESESELGTLSEETILLSTIPLIGERYKDYVQITPFLAEREVQIIQDRIDHIIKKKKARRLKEHLTYMSKEALFLKNRDFENENKALEYMVKILEEKGYVNEHFLKEVKQREATSSTAFSHIAVPHSMKMNTEKTGMFVMLNEKPVTWGESQVNIILLFAVNQEDRGVFHDVFDNLIVLLLEKINANRVISSNTYQEFIDKILKCFEESSAT